MEGREEFDWSLDAFRDWSGHQTPATASGAQCVIRHGIT